MIVDERETASYSPKTFEPLERQIYYTIYYRIRRKTFLASEKVIYYTVYHI